MRDGHQEDLIPCPTPIPRRRLAGIWAVTDTDTAMQLIWMIGAEKLANARSLLTAGILGWVGFGGAGGLW
jgi:hypothetical protein